VQTNAGLRRLAFVSTCKPGVDRPAKPDARESCSARSSRCVGRAQHSNTARRRFTLPEGLLTAHWEIHPTGLSPRLPGSRNLMVWLQACLRRCTSGIPVYSTATWDFITQPLLVVITYRGC